VEKGPDMGQLPTRDDQPRRGSTERKRAPIPLKNRMNRGGKERKNGGQKQTWDTSAEEKGTNPYTMPTADQGKDK